MWIKILNDIYGFKLLENQDYNNLEKFCKTCDECGIQNNSTFKDMKIDEFQGKFGQYWCVYHIPTNKIISVSAIHKLPLQIDAWGKDIIKDCWRIGVRHATIPSFRVTTSTGLGNNLQNSFQFGHVFPMQIEESLRRGAKKIIYTTNTSKNSEDKTGKLFQMDRVIHILSKKGYCIKVEENKKIYHTYQNIWELYTERWNQ